MSSFNFFHHGGVHTRSIYFPYVCFPGYHVACVFCRVRPNEPVLRRGRNHLHEGCQCQTHSNHADVAMSDAGSKSDDELGDDSRVRTWQFKWNKATVRIPFERFTEDAAGVQWAEDTYGSDWKNMDLYMEGTVVRKSRRTHAMVDPRDESKTVDVPLWQVLLEDKDKYFLCRARHHIPTDRPATYRTPWETRRRCVHCVHPFLPSADKVRGRTNGPLSDAWDED